MVSCCGMSAPTRLCFLSYDLLQVQQGASDIGLAWIYKDKYQ